ncbi:MAG: hypothetical protein WBV11_14560, partial [Salegentibacter sp.]
MLQSFRAFYSEYSGRLLWVCLFFFLFVHSRGNAQQNYPGYDELSVEMKIPNLGVLEIPVAIKGQDAYLPVAELFDRLKIRNEITENG